MGGLGADGRRGARGVSTVSVIIPYTTRDALCEAAIASVQRALERAPEVDGEVLPIDDEARTGVSAARNRGLAQAKGDWIVFVDADDELGEEFFSEVFLPYAEDPAVDLIVADHVEAGPAGKALLKGNHYIERRILNRDSHVWGKAFRREAIGDLRFDESLTIGEDMLFLVDLALRIAERGKRVAVPGVAGYRYRINPAGAMEQAFRPAFLDELRCWRIAQERLMPHAREFTAYAFPALGAIRIRSALMVAGRIAEAEQAADPATLSDANRLCREAFREAMHLQGAFAALSMRDKCRALLYDISPRIYARMYYAKQQKK